MAEDADGGEKSEQPSGRKLARARSRGQVAQSREINTWFMLMAGAGIIMVLSPSLARMLGRLMITFLEFDRLLGPEGIQWNAIQADLRQAASALVLPLLVLMVAAIAGSIFQTGLLLATAKFQFNLNSMSPLSGLSKLFSLRALSDLVKNLIKIGVVGGIAGWLALPAVQHLPLLIASPVEQIPSAIYHVVLRLVMGVLVLATIMALGDYLYQRFTFMRSMRMTKQEVKDENKQAEGDPAIKSRLRQIRMDRARKRMMAAVAKASVVITNPTHYAVALQYEMGESNAPRLVAKGVDFLALRIREIAEAHDVPIVSNPPLARTLYATVEIDREIPPEHYKAVAEIIGYVFRLKGKMRR